MSSPDLVDALVSDLVPARRSAPLRHAMFGWCGLSWGWVLAIMLTVGPLRQGVLAELVESPRLALEVVIGLLAGNAAMLIGLELGVPGTPAPLRLASAPLMLFGGWILVVLGGLTDPTEVIIAGHSAPMRGLCFLETMGVSLPSAAAALYLLHGRILFAPGFAGLLTGAAAAALPALWMELACMSEPIHGLKFHLSPIRDDRDHHGATRLSIQNEGLAPAVV